jgi:hypothetical protein
VAPANNADVVRAPHEKVVVVRAFFRVSRADIGGPFSAERSAKLKMRR